MADVHPREFALPGREKIFSNNVAHVLNDETSRKYIQSLKRLVRAPSPPPLFLSRSVSVSRKKTWQLTRTLIHTQLTFAQAVRPPDDVSQK